ncbi:OmpH family outer membrane protein [uncultured Odoribacter sp.]|uniref:OmpH family outer membrane protein n=1 Tax=uncultured Odoribacter sp. TaxID=876416 RepID=UPI00261477F2|nr:OmpH family outer membrane protein [uncultured Odoribacter sp.]
MKNYSIVLNVILLIAVAVLYILHFTGNRENAPVRTSMEGNGTVNGTKIVYVNTDTLLNNYLLSIELNEAFLKKQEERRTELNLKAKQLDQQANEFQRKLENNGFISRERAEAARQEILDKNQRLQMLQQDMTEKMLKEQSDLNKRLFESITSFLTEYNKEKGYDIVLSTVLAGNVLYAESGFDITGDVVKRLNEKYNQKKAE